MTTAEVRLPPSRRDLQVFALILALFGLALGALLVYRPRALYVAATFLVLGWAASLSLRREHRRRATVGLGLPLLFALLASLNGVVPGRALAATTAASFLGAAAAVWVSPSFGRALRDGWMKTVEPMGWSVSHLVLALVYFLVLSPIGLVLRLTGRDLLRLRRNPSGRQLSGWHEHSTPSDLRRYFRQF